MQWLGFWWVNIKPILVPFHHNSECTYRLKGVWAPNCTFQLLLLRAYLQINLLLPESVPWNTNGESPTKDDQVLWLLLLLLEGLNRRARDFAWDNDQQGIIIFLNNADNLINIFKGYGQISLESIYAQRWFNIRAQALIHRVKWLKTTSIWAIVFKPPCIMWG